MCRVVSVRDLQGAAQEFLGSWGSVERWDGGSGYVDPIEDEPGYGQALELSTAGPSALSSSGRMESVSVMEEPPPKPPKALLAGGRRKVS